MSLDSHSPLEKPVQPPTSDDRPNFQPFGAADHSVWQNIASLSAQDAGRVMKHLGLPTFEFPNSATKSVATTSGEAGKGSEWVKPVPCSPPADNATRAQPDSKGVSQTPRLSSDWVRPVTQPSNGIDSAPLGAVDQTSDVGPMLMPPRPEDWVMPEIKPGVSVEAARQSVTDAAEKNLSPTEAGRFKADMQKFEDRARADHVSNEQVAETYQNIEQLLNAKDGPLEAIDRHLLAEQVMAISADPNKARTGSSITCGPVELETLIYKNFPADAANVVAQVAMSGQYRASDGTTVTPEMIPTDESRRSDDASARLFASQIFQNSAIDATLKAGGSNLTYHHEYGAEETRADNEYYLDPTGARIAFDGTTSADLVNMYREITGKKDLVIIDNSVGSSDENVKRVNSPGQLQTLLVHLKEEGNPPTIIGVDTRNQPFWDEQHMSNAPSGNEDPADPHYHWVAINGYDPKTATISFHNGWDDPDHKINVHDMYRGTQKVDASLPEMGKDFVHSLATGRGNYAEAIDALRIRSETGRINDAELNRLFNRDMQGLVAQRGTHSLDDRTTRNGILELRNYLSRKNALSLDSNLGKLLSAWERAHEDG